MLKPTSSISPASKKDRASSPPPIRQMSLPRRRFNRRTNSAASVETIVTAPPASFVHVRENTKVCLSGYGAFPLLCPLAHSPSPTATLILLALSQHRGR